MSRFFRLTNADVATNCFGAIHQAVMDNKDGKKFVTVTIDVTTEDKARSTAQNRLYWMWLHQFAKHTGASDTDLHLDFKRRMLAKIFYRDDTEFAEMTRSVKALEQVLDGREYEHIATGLAKLMSTTRATTAQMTEYLNAIYAFCYDKGCLLKVPDELAWVRE